MLSVRKLRSSTLLGLLLIGVLLFQIGAYDPSHGDDHGRHCCPACHAGHISATTDSRFVVIIPPTGAQRYVGSDTLLSAPEPASISGCSRAPPSA